MSFKIDYEFVLQDFSYKYVIFYLLKSSNFQIFLK